MVHDFDLADGQINVGENQKLIFSWICFQKPYTSQQNFWDAANAVLETAETERFVKENNTLIPTYISNSHSHLNCLYF